jgi:hypothetical protein
MDIDNMPVGRELDALVAEKVMGLKPCVFKEKGSISGMVRFWECECKTSGACYPINKEAISHHNSMLSKYSTDIAAAWEVLEFLKNKLNIDCMSLEWDNKYRCYIRLDDDDIDDDVDADIKFYCGIAESPSLAICRVALKAVDA